MNFGDGYDPTKDIRQPLRSDKVEFVETHAVALVVQENTTLVQKRYRLQTEKLRNCPKTYFTLFPAVGGGPDGRSSYPDHTRQ